MYLNRLFEGGVRIECCKTKTRVATTTNQKTVNTLRANENSKWKEANCLKRGKTRVTMSRLVLVLNLIGWGSSGSLLDQSLNERNQNQSNSELLSTLNSKLLNKWELIVQPRQGGQRQCKHLFLPLVPLALDILEIISFFCKIENC